MNCGSESYGGETLTATAKCIEVENLGTVETPWGKKKQTKVVFDADVEGSQCPVCLTRTYNLSLHQMSALSKDLASWRGQELTEEERGGGFKLKKMVGEECRLELREVLGKEGRTYLKIVRILPANQSFNQPEPIEELAFVSMEGGGQ
jgi:hypothetical protein